VESTEGIEPVLEIALHEQVNPRKGFELLLSHHGICRAITLFDQYPDPATREHCLGLLVHHIHSELVDRLKRAIEQNEGSAPETAFVPDLLTGRDWLFGEYDSYIDTSHLISVLPLQPGVQRPSNTVPGGGLAEYGRHLGSMYHQAGERRWKISTSITEHFCAPCSAKMSTKPCSTSGTSCPITTPTRLALIRPRLS